MSFLTDLQATSPWGLWMETEASGSTLADSSGNSRPMTITGSVTGYQQAMGSVQTGIAWPNNVAVTSAGSTPSSTQDFTAMVVFYVPADIVANAHLFSINQTPGSTTGFEMSLELLRTNSTTNQLRISMFNTAIRTVSGSSGGIVQNTLYVAFFKATSAGGMLLYLNKASAATLAQNAASGRMQQPTRIHDGKLATNGAVRIGAVAFWQTGLSTGTMDTLTDSANTFWATLATTLAGATLAASGTETITGTLASTLAGATLAASGTSSGGSVTGTLATTLDGATLAASGTSILNVTGTLASTLSGATLAASGTETISGTLATTLSGATLAASGTETISGTLTTTLSAATLSAIANEKMTGTLATTLAGATLAASGTVIAPITGTLAVTLDGATLSAVGGVIQNVTGTLAVTLDGATLVASGNSHQPFRNINVLVLANASRVIELIDVSRSLTPTESPRPLTITEQVDV